MPHFYDSFPPNLQQWALRQSIFFTASAPLTGRHVNLSPKGLPSTTFTIFDDNHAGYIDATGSGIETISHIYENGRVTVMFCSFDSKPRILRLFCTGRVVEFDGPDFGVTVRRMGKEAMMGARAIVLLDIWKVQTSCGYAVPVISETPHPEAEHSREITAVNDNVISQSTGQELEQPPCKCFTDRHMLEQWLVHKVNKKSLDAYQVQFNSRSLDGLLGLRLARKQRGEYLLVEDVRAALARRFGHLDALILGIVIGVALVGCFPVVLDLVLWYALLVRQMVRHVVVPFGQLVLL